MASTFRVSPKLIAYMFDLPQGTEVTEIVRVPDGNGGHSFEIAVEVEGWPDGPIELIYEDHDGVPSLTGILPIL